MYSQIQLSLRQVSHLTRTMLMNQYYKKSQISPPSFIATNLYKLFNFPSYSHSQEASTSQIISTTTPKQEPLPHINLKMLFKTLILLAIAIVPFAACFPVEALGGNISSYPLYPSISCESGADIGQSAPLRFERQMREYFQEIDWQVC